ncbi:MAG: tetratricopeptide repeat protein [Alistipes sp.]|nr:tetratricopeptide repeat protein [Alistipes sp.]
MKFLLPLFTLLMCGACSFNELQHTLRATLQLAQEHPDSALQQLRSLDTDRVYSRRLKADYALVYSILLDKNYIDQQSDSLIHIPYDYYGSHATSDSVRHLVHYYRGRIHQNNREFHPATREYLTALHHLDTLRKPYECGLIYSRLGAMYRAQHNRQSALDCYLRAYDYFQISNKASAVYYTTFDLAHTYHNLGDYTTSEHWYLHTIEQAKEHHDNYIIGLSLSNLMIVYRNMAESEKIIRTFTELKKIPGYAFTAVNYMCLANAYLTTNQNELASTYLTKAKELNNTDNLLLLNHLQFRMAMRKKQFNEASSYHNNLLKTVDSVLHRADIPSISRVETDFYKERNAFAQYRLNIKNTIEIVSALAFLAILVAFLCYHRWQIRRKEREIFDFMAATEQMKEQYNHLQLALSSKEQNETDFKNVLANHFSTLDDLCRTFFEHDSANAQQKAIYKEVRQRLDALSNSRQARQELDDVINITHGHLMDKLTAQLPTLNPDDVHFLRLIYAGFSSQVISVVTHESIQNTYARKHRLKKRMMQSNAPDKELFINALR